jgi:hypothetical protein
MPRIRSMRAQFSAPGRKPRFSAVAHPSKPIQKCRVVRGHVSLLTNLRHCGKRYGRAAAPGGRARTVARAGGALLVEGLPRPEQRRVSGDLILHHDSFSTTIHPSYSSTKGWTI